MQGSEQSEKTECFVAQAGSRETDFMIGYSVRCFLMMAEQMKLVNSKTEGCSVDTKPTCKVKNPDRGLR